MKESFRKGVANHPDPEPCEGGGNVALELKRWPGAYVGWASLKLMSSEIAKIMGADGVRPTGRQAGKVAHYLIFGSNAFVAYFIWPLVKVQTLGYFDISAF